MFKSIYSEKIIYLLGGFDNLVIIIDTRQIALFCTQLYGEIFHQYDTLAKFDFIYNSHQTNIKPLLVK